MFCVLGPRVSSLSSLEKDARPLTCELFLKGLATCAAKKVAGPISEHSRGALRLSVFKEPAHLNSKTYLDV